MNNKDNKDKKNNNTEEVIFEEEFTEKKEKKKKSSFFRGDKTEKLKKEIEALKKEKKEYLDGWQRARAEIVNIKKRHDDEKKIFTTLGKEALLDQIIPVLDNFDSAFSGSAWENVDQNWRLGIEYIYNQFVKILEENNVEAFGEVDEEFDEKLHHSVEVEENNDKEKSGKISKVLMKGYKIKDRIIREAKVKIYK